MVDSIYEYMVYGNWSHWSKQIGEACCIDSCCVLKLILMVGAQEISTWANWIKKSHAHISRMKKQLFYFVAKLKKQNQIGSVPWLMISLHITILFGSECKEIKGLFRICYNFFCWKKFKDIMDIIGIILCVIWLQKSDLIIPQGAVNYTQTAVKNLHGSEQM